MSREADVATPAGATEVPSTGSGPGVLVLTTPETSQLRAEACRRLARHGFVAQPVSVTPGAGTCGDPALVEAGIDALFRAEATTGARVGVLGFGAAGALALAAAAAGARLGVLAWLDPELDEEALAGIEAARIDAPLLLVCAEKGAAVERGSGGRLEARLRSEGAACELRVQPGTQSGFADPARADAYDAVAAGAAWDAALARLRAEL